MSGNLAKSSSDWLFVATSLAQLPNSVKQALSCMALAGDLAQTTAELIEVSRAWSQTFGDAEAALQCLAKAESVAEDEEEFIHIAEAWVESEGVDQAARILREFVEPRPWSYLTELQEMYGSRKDGTTVLDWVEPVMTERAARDTVSEAEEHYYGNKVEAVRLLVEAEKQAEHTSDWILIARAWAKGLDSSVDAHLCMTNAGQLFDNAYDNLRLAKAWKNDFHRLAKAIAFLEAAEEAAGEDEACWELILNAWKEDHRDPHNYLRCAEKCAIAMNGQLILAHNALMDYFARDQFIRKQMTFIDLGTLGKSPWNIVGVWTVEAVSERQQGCLARYYSFTLERRGSLDIILEVDEEYYDEAILLLVEGSGANGQELAQDSGQWSRIKHDLGPGTYTIEVRTEADSAFQDSEIFTLKITFSAH